MTKLLATVLSIASFPVLAAGSLPPLHIREMLFDLMILVGVGIILGIAWYLVGAAPFINDMFKKVLQYAILVVGGLILIYLILGWIGM